MRPISYGITNGFERTENGLDFLRALQLGGQLLSIVRRSLTAQTEGVEQIFHQETMSNNEIPFTRPIAKNLPSLDRVCDFFLFGALLILLWMDGMGLKLVA